MKAFFVSPFCTNHQIPTVGEARCRGNQHRERKLPSFVCDVTDGVEKLLCQRIVHQRFESHVKTPLGFARMLSNIPLAVIAVYLPGGSYRCSGSHSIALDQLSYSSAFLLKSILLFKPASTLSCSKSC